MDIILTISNRIYQWANNEPSDTYIKQEFPSGFEKTSVVFKSENNIFECFQFSYTSISAGFQMRVSNLSPLFS